MSTVTKSDITKASLNPKPTLCWNEKWKEVESGVGSEGKDVVVRPLIPASPTAQHARP